jgi:hypothetical protein
MCRACNHPAHDGEPTCRDITAADADLFEHDKQKPRHIYPCGEHDCWVCEHVVARMQEAS